MDREEKIELARFILGIIGAAGILSVALIAPNAFGAYAQIAKQIKSCRRNKFNYRVRRAVGQIEKRGLICIQNGKARLTSLGEQELMLYETKRKMIQKPKKWDGKWRIVMFDIWEKRRLVRDAVRRYLNQLGFVRLQHSVWAFPYDCKEVVDLLKTYHKVRPAVLYMVVESLENDKFLRQKFGLK